MALLNNPVTIEILRESGALELIDVIPVYEETPRAFVATDILRIYEGFPKDDDEDPSSDIKRDRYLQYLEFYGADNPLFLGELHIRGNGLPDWQYHGSRLTENEIWQIVATLMPHTDGYINEEAAIDAILNEDEPIQEGLAFMYSYGLESVIVRIEEANGHFIILLNEEVAAQVEMPDETWEVTAGEIDDKDLLAEVIARISAATR